MAPKLVKLSSSRNHNYRENTSREQFQSFLEFPKPTTNDFDEYIEEFLNRKTDRNLGIRELDDKIAHDTLPKRRAMQ